MPHPTLRFAFNPEFDADLAWLFYSNPEYGGENFWNKGAIPYHAELKNLNRKQDGKSFLRSYILNLYQENDKSIHQRGQEIQQLYRLKKKDFFKETDRIFHKSGLQGRYTAYFSVFDFCPRFLDKKCFFVFLSQNDSDVLFTIYHELLHFYFYRYCLSVYSAVFKDMDTEHGAFWEIAELFNGVVMQTAPFSKQYNIVPSFGYPELSRAFKQAKRSWNGHIDQWMNEFALPYIHAKNSHQNSHRKISDSKYFS